MQRLSWLSLVILTLLTSCMPFCNCGNPAISPEGLRPSETRLDPSVLVSITRKPLIVEELGSCPLNEVEVPGEGFRIKGGIGGLAMAPNPLGVTPVNPRALAFTLAKIANPSSEQSSALIVVDDFNGSLRQPGVYFLDQQDGMKLADLTSSAIEADVQMLEAGRQYAHGTLVLNHTLALLSGIDPNLEVTSVRVSIPEEDVTISLPVVTFPKLGVSVVALDTENFDTGIIAERLEATIRTLAQFGILEAREQGITRFAVNMSFGLVPCSVLADIDAAKSLTFEAYTQDVLDANGLDAAAFRDDLVNILTTPVGNDPLQGILEQRNEGDLDISYIAAAGNYRLPFALFPGYWSEFVSVSAMNMASPTPVKDPDYSNTGEVLMEGGYFTLTGYDPATGGWRNYPQISVAGTSFAAPVLSVFTALDLTKQVPRCARQTGDIASPLAFFKTDAPVLVPIPMLDQTLEKALSRYCP